MSGKERWEKRYFQPRASSWQISKRWEVLSEKGSPSAHLISYILSQSIHYQTLSGVLDLSGMTALVSMTPLEQRATASMALLLEHCSSLQTLSQTYHAHRTLKLHGGISVTVRQH